MFHHGGYYGILEWESNAIEFQQFWKEITSMHTANKKSVVKESDVVALPFRELLQQFAP